MQSLLNETGYFFGDAKRRLFYQSWRVESPQGIIFITHGLSENTDRYESLARFLNEDGWSVYAWDLRGHGRSSGLRGFVKNFRLFERDLIHFAHFILKKEKSLPVVFIGHSLGGLITARSLYHEENIVSSAAGVCLLAPAIGLRVNISLFKLCLVYTTHFLCPWLVYYNKILSAHLSRDPYFQQVIENDLFRHSKVSPEIYLTVLKNPKLMREGFPFIQPKLLIQTAGADVIVDNIEAKKLFDRVQTSGEKKFIVYPSSRHQLMEDYDRSTVMEDLRTYIRPLLKKQASLKT